MKSKFSRLKLRFEMNPTSSGSHLKPPFFKYIKPYMIYFKDTEKFLRENTRFTRNSESKRGVLTKHSQVNIS